LRCSGQHDEDGAPATVRARSPASAHDPLAILPQDREVKILKRQAQPPAISGRAAATPSRRPLLPRTVPPTLHCSLSHIIETPLRPPSPCHSQRKRMQHAARRAGHQLATIYHMFPAQSSITRDRPITTDCLNVELRAASPRHARSKQRCPPVREIVPLLILSVRSGAHTRVARLVYSICERGFDL
jgi:hypothetical protein